MAVVEVDRVVAGGRALHRQMQAQLGMHAPGVGHQARVGEDHRVDAERRRPIDGAGPALPVVGLGVGVEGQQDLAAAVVGVATPSPRALSSKLRPLKLRALVASLKPR